MSAGDAPVSLEIEFKLCSDGLTEPFLAVLDFAQRLVGLADGLGQCLVLIAAASEFADLPIGDPHGLEQREQIFGCPLNRLGSDDHQLDKGSLSVSLRDLGLLPETLALSLGSVELVRVAGLLARDQHQVVEPKVPLEFQAAKGTKCRLKSDVGSPPVGIQARSVGGSDLQLAEFPLVDTVGSPFGCPRGRSFALARTVRPLREHYSTERSPEHANQSGEGAPASGEGEGDELHMSQATAMGSWAWATRGGTTRPGLGSRRSWLMNGTARLARASWAQLGPLSV